MTFKKERERENEKKNTFLVHSIPWTEAHPKHYLQINVPPSLRRYWISLVAPTVWRPLLLHHPALWLQLMRRSQRRVCRWWSGQSEGFVIFAWGFTPKKTNMTMGGKKRDWRCISYYKEWLSVFPHANLLESTFQGPLENRGSPGLHKLPVPFPYFNKFLSQWW